MRFGSVAFGAVIAASALMSSAAADDAAPRLFRADAEVVDVGTVYAGSVAIAEFVFHNPTDRDVRILRAKPT